MRTGKTETLNPVYPISCALLCLILVVYAEISYVFMLGFPDHFVSELDSAEEKLAIWFQRVSFIIALWFVYVGFFSRMRKLFFYSVCLYLLLLGIAVSIDLYFHMNLMDSRGG